MTLHTWEKQKIRELGLTRNQVLKLRAKYLQSAVDQGLTRFEFCKLTGCARGSIGKIMDDCGVWLESDKQRKAREWLDLHAAGKTVEEAAAILGKHPSTGNYIARAYNISWFGSEPQEPRRSVPLMVSPDIAAEIIRTGRIPSSQISQQA